jgi:hypothetical protein
MPPKGNLSQYSGTIDSGDHTTPCRPRCEESIRRVGGQRHPLIRGWRHLRGHEVPLPDVRGRLWVARKQRQVLGGSKEEFVDDPVWALVPGRMVLWDVGA